MTPFAPNFPHETFDIKHILNALFWRIIINFNVQSYMLKFHLVRLCILPIPHIDFIKAHKIRDFANLSRVGGQSASFLSIKHSAVYNKIIKLANHLKRRIMFNKYKQCFSQTPI